MFHPVLEIIYYNLIMYTKFKVAYLSLTKANLWKSAVAF